jgi:hypothetical protein
LSITEARIIQMRLIYTSKNNELTQFNDKNSLKPLKSTL